MSAHSGRFNKRAFKNQTKQMIKLDDLFYAKEKCEREKIVKEEKGFRDKVKSANSLVNSLLFPRPSSSYTINNLEGLEIAIDQFNTPCPFLIHPYKEDVNFVVLYFHGNYEDIGDCKGKAEKISDIMCCHVIAPEYPGYGCTNCDSMLKYFGESSFIPQVDEYHFLKRAEFALEYVQNVHNVPLERIVVFGYSIGAALACHLASKHHDRLAGIISLSGFSSFKDFATEFTMLGHLTIERFENATKLSTIPEDTKLRLLVYHGGEDDLINPETHPKKLYNAFKGTEKKIVNDLKASHVQFNAHVLKSELSAFALDIDQKLFSLDREESKGVAIEDLQQRRNQISKDFLNSCRNSPQDSSIEGVVYKNISNFDQWYRKKLILNCHTNTTICVQKGLLPVELFKEIHGNLNNYEMEHPTSAEFDRIVRARLLYILKLCLHKYVYKKCRKRITKFWIEDSDDVDLFSELMQRIRKSISN